MTKNKQQIAKEDSKKIAENTKSKNQFTDEQKVRGIAAVHSDNDSLDVVLTDDGMVKVGDHEDMAKNRLDFVETTGTEGYRAACLIVKQICSLDLRGSGHDVQTMAETFNMLHGIKPKDNVESMLAAQMVAVHKMAMSCAANALHDGQTLDREQLNINSVNKLTKSFVALSNALDKRRGKGQQKMTVEHVHVNEGGQAIIGTVEQKEAQKVFEDKEDQ